MIFGVPPNHTVESVPALLSLLPPGHKGSPVTPRGHPFYPKDATFRMSLTFFLSPYLQANYITQGIDMPHLAFNYPLH